MHWSTLTPFLPLLYPIITAGASLIYPILDKNKYWHAVFSFLAGLGIDLPKVWNAIVRLMPTDTGKAARVAAKTMIVLVALIAVSAIESACIPPAQEAADVQAGLALEQCVQTNWGKPFLTVVATCGPQEEDAVAQAIASIVAFFTTTLDAGTFANPYAAEPKVVAAMPAAVAKLGHGR